jgi:hypothetical protein
MLLSNVQQQSVQAQNGNTLIISELMADNSTILSDEDGDYSDWVEIQNITDQDIDIGGWYLSDNPDNLIKWIFPNQMITRNGYLVVFASGKDKRTDELHTNFKLSNAGEQIYLTRPDGKTIEYSIKFPPQSTDASYSIINQSWVFSDPTPGESNDVGSFINPPEFSVNHGFFDQPFTLAFSNPTGDSIIYSIGGSKPVVENGHIYNSPITIDSTVVIRAMAFRGIEKSTITSRTYIFPDKVKSQPGDPEGYPEHWGTFTTIDGIAPADYGMDPEICSDPNYKDLLVPALKSIPSLSIVTDKKYLFSPDVDAVNGGIYIHTGAPTGGYGEGWERPASVEYLLPDGKTGFQVNCGLRIHGGHSRVPEKNPKHSFRLIFKNEYGPETLNYPIFNDHASQIFNTLVLRAGFNQTWLHWDDGQRNAAQYIHDSWAKDTWRQMGHTAAHNKFVHLYINGMYWGLYNISERMDDVFMADYLGGSKEDFDIIKDYGEVAEGDKGIWNEMMNMARNGLSDAVSYYKLQGKNEFGKEDESLEAYLDIPNLIDFMILNFYAGNLDWDHHNWVASRNRTEPGHGFQFFPWDSERIFYKLYNNVVDENNEDRPSFLYNQLRKNPVFRMDFAKRANELLGPGGILSPDSVKASWAKRSAEIELAVIAESARWGDYRRDVHPHQNEPYELYTKADHWDKQLNWLENEYFPKRSQIVLDQLRDIGLSGELVTILDNIDFNSANLAVYPNPFQHDLTIKYQLFNSGYIDVSITSLDGKIIHQLYAGYQPDGMHEIQWLPDKLSSGMYFCKIMTQNGVFSEKLVYIE